MINQGELNENLYHTAGTNCIVFEYGGDDTDLCDEAREMCRNNADMMYLPELSMLISGIAFADTATGFAWMITRETGSDAREVFEMMTVRLCDLVHSDEYDQPKEILTYLADEREKLMEYVKDDIEVAYSPAGFRVYEAVRSRGLGVLYLIRYENGNEKILTSEQVFSLVLNTGVVITPTDAATAPWHLLAKITRAHAAEYDDDLLPDEFG